MISQTLQRICTVINEITNDTFIGKLIISAGSVVTSFLAPIQYLLMICFATTIVDMIFGIQVARKQKKKIESGKNWDGTIKKLIGEFTIIALTHGIEWSILGQSGVFLLTGGVTAIIALTEMWSILENLNTLDPKGPWKLLNKYLKKKGQDYTGINFDYEYTNDSSVVKEPLESSR